jgi:hypothetical protein
MAAKAGALLLLALVIAGCGSSGGNYDTRPIKGTRCFQIQHGDNYTPVGSGTYCEVPFPPPSPR